MIPVHRLSRQILATLIANDIVNRMGPSFVKRAQADTGASILTVARAYEVARIICRARPLLKEIESLDHVISARAQMLMMFEVSRTLRHACYWLIEKYGEELDVVNTVDRLKAGMAKIYSRSSSYVSKAVQARIGNARKAWLDMGVPEKLAGKIALLLLTRAAVDIVDLAADRKRDVIESARLYSAFNDALGLQWLHNSAEDLEVSGRWQAMARNNLREDFFSLRRQIGDMLLTKRGTRDSREIARRWLAKHKREVQQFQRMIDEMKLRENIDFATLSVAAQELRNLISS